MLVALLILNVVHPGRLMPGKVADMPSWRQRRKQRREAKAQGQPLAYFRESETQSVDVARKV